jgi:hypothetical protein
VFAVPGGVFGPLSAAVRAELGVKHDIKTLPLDRHRRCDEHEANLSMVPGRKRSVDDAEEAGNCA